MMPSLVAQSSNDQPDPTTCRGCLSSVALATRSTSDCKSTGLARFAGLNGMSPFQFFGGKSVESASVGFFPERQTMCLLLVVCQD
jgi:hypothetical protein